jgi:quinone-modifying oxidoreductase subunit QmoC
MAGPAVQLSPSPEVRRELAHRGASTAGRCYQCATCSSVCELSTPEIPFPRTQMLLAQWGLKDRLSGDPAVWLCHQCGDCTERCPRDARPGDVLQGLRSTVIETLAFPSFAGKLVGNVRKTWPLLLGVPWAFWLVLWALGVVQVQASENGLLHAFEDFASHGVIYAVFFPVAGYVTLAAGISGIRFWKKMGEGSSRRGSFLSGLWPVMLDVLGHKSFGACSKTVTRRWAHLALFWGFVGAAVTSGLLVYAIYVQGESMPLPLLHPFKILGNLSAAALVVGGVLLFTTRFGTYRSLISSSAIDVFFLSVVGLVILTGVVIEVARFTFPANISAFLYTFHLGVVMTLFLTFPYSKFAHMLYRTLALVHQRVIDSQQTRKQAA